MNGREYRNLGQAAFASQTVLPRRERNCLNPDDQKRDRASGGQPAPAEALCAASENVVLPGRIELPTSPLPRECSTSELRQLLMGLINY